jgi:hypothetical protein
LQNRRKQCFRCHPIYAVPPSADLQGPAMRPLFACSTVRLARLSQNKIRCAYPFPIAGSPNCDSARPILCARVRLTDLLSSLRFHTLATGTLLWHSP